MPIMWISTYCSFYLSNKGFYLLYSELSTMPMLTSTLAYYANTQKTHACKNIPHTSAQLAINHLMFLKPLI